MTRDEILNMAREAGAEPESLNIFDASTTSFGWSFGADELERFAALVAAAEREACAKVCEVVGPELCETYGDAAECISTAEACAAAIRARSKT